MVFKVRELYCPGHFGNWYEAAWPNEMASYLKEMREMGFNEYSDWFTSTDSSTPGTGYHTLSMELFQRKLQNFRNAYELGFKLNLGIPPNHVFLNQLQKEYLAKTGPRIIGQLICPSNPQARKLIKKNAEFQFKLIKDSGISLNAVVSFAYDYGGCLCEKCKPWILTWANLMNEIYEAGKKYYPELKLRFSTWWWVKEEYEIIKQLLDKNKTLRSNLTLVFYIPYGKTDIGTYDGKTVPDMPVDKMAFFNIGYCENREDADLYGKKGPVIAPERIQKTLQNLQKRNFSGYMAYSEGIYDELNKVICGLISSGQVKEPKEAIDWYVKRYFETDKIKEWCEYLYQWRMPFKVDLQQAHEDLLFLKNCTQNGNSWRVSHWESKLRLFQLNKEIMKRKRWDGKRKQLAEIYMSEWEHLCRDIYRLGPLRHIFGPRFAAFPWYESWVKTSKLKTDRIAMNKQA